MKATELRTKTQDQLKQELKDLLKEQFNLRMQRGMSEEGVRSHQFGVVRRQIARVKTILQEKAKGSDNE